jgi:hypothetical protein
LMHEGDDISRFSQHINLLAIVLIT